MASKDKRPGQSPRPHQRTEKTPPQKTPWPPEEIDALSPEEMRRMLHELQARQAELEKQNEELRTAQAQGTQQSEKLYHSLFDHMLNGFAYCRMLFDKGVPQDFIYLAVNETFETRTGLKNVVGKKVTEVIPGIRETDPRLFEIYARVATTGKPEYFEMFVEALRDWFSISVYCPAPEHFVVVFDVITGRKRAEAALRESEERYRLLADNADDIVLMHDADGRRLYISPSYYRVTGWTEDDLNATPWQTRLHPEDLPLLERTHAANLRGETTCVEHRILCKNGPYLWVENRCRPILDAQGKVQVLMQWSRDITERKKAEALLRKSEELFREAFYLAGVGKAQADPVTGRFLRVNLAFCEFLGYTEAELLQKTFFDVTLPEERQADAELYQQLLRGEIPTYSREKTYLRKDSALVWGLLSPTVLFDCDGRPILVSAVIQNIADRKRAEEALRASDERLNFALKMSYIGAWELDLRDHTANRTLLHDQIFGYETLLPSWTYEMFLEHVVPEDRAEVDRKFRQATAAQNDWGFECRIRRADGEVRWIWAAGGHERRSQGAPVRISGIVQDITDRKRAEEALQVERTQLRTLIDNLPDAVYFKDLESRFLVANQTVANIVKLASPETMIGRTDADFTSPEWASQYRAEEVRVMQEGKGIYGREDCVTLPDGSIRWESITKIPLRDESGKVIGLVGVNRDITSRKQAQEALQKNEILNRRLVEHLPHRVFVKNRDLVYLACNANYARDLGVTPDQVVGKDDFAFHAADLAETFRADDRAVMENGQIKELEERYFVSGQERWARTVKVPYRDERGEIIGVLGVYEDITDRKQAEAALKTERLQLRTLIDNLSDPVYIKDTQSRFVVANLATARYGGLDDPDQLIGRSDADFMPEDKARQCRDEEVQVIQGQGIYGKEEWLTTPDGVRRWLSTTKVPLKDDAGNVIGLVGINYDLTSHKQAEAALHESNAILQAAMDQSSAGIAIAEAPSGVLRYVNNAGLFIRGADRENVVNEIGIDKYVASWHILDLDGRALNPDEVPLARAILFGETCSREFIIRRAPGDDRIVSANAAPIKDDDGKIVAGIVVFTDITEHKRAEETLRRNEADLLQAKQRLEMAQLAGRIGTFEWNAQCPNLLKTTGMHIVYGGRPEDVRDQYDDWHSRVHPDDIARVDQHIADALAGKVEYDTEFRIIWRDGSIHWVSARGKVERDDQGRPLRAFGVNIDTTQRKQTEDALLAKEQEYRVLVENLSSGIVVHAADTSIVFSNPMAATLLGLTEDQMRGKTAPDPAWCFTRDDGAAMPLAEYPVNRVLSSGQPTRSLVLGIRHPGRVEPTWVLCNAYPVRDAGGQIAQVVVTFVDITDRKRAEAALRESEEWHRTIIQTALSGFCLADTQGHLLEVNESYCRMSGYSEQELLAMSIRDIEEAEPPEETAARIQKIMTQGWDRFESRHHRKDGSIYDVEISVKYRPDNGGRLVIFIRDITERKRADEKLRRSKALLSATGKMAKVGGWEFCLQTQALTWTDEVYRIHEVADDFQPTVAAAVDFYTPESRPIIAEAVRRAIEHGEAFDLELQIVTARGERRWVHAMGNAQSKDGHVVSVGGTFQDITDRKRAEAEKEKLEDQLRQAQKMESVGRLAGGVAHDFNNMLGVILGHVELALAKMDPKLPLHASLTEVRKAAQRSADLTRQLLAFARKQTVAPKVLDLNEAVEGSLKMLKRLIGENVNLNWQPAPALWPVRMDPSQFDQILTNLCVNASHAIADVGRITIETGNCSFTQADCLHHAGFVPGQYVRLTVSDTGCGMDKETLAHIFEPFFTTKGIGKGTGLGLATVYGAVKQNSGFIDVYSEPGQGTTFRIYLPHHTSKTASAGAQDAPRPLSPGQETILLVEDEPAILKMATMMLQSMGYKVVAANSPGEAIRLAQEHSGEIHLLMTDVVMPEMNGRSLAQNLLRLYPDIKRLFMSGYTADVIAHHGVLDEGVFFIQKPFSINELALKIREALDQK